MKVEKNKNRLIGEVRNRRRGQFNHDHRLNQQNCWTPFNQHQSISNQSTLINNKSIKSINFAIFQSTKKSTKTLLISMSMLILLILPSVVVSTNLVESTTVDYSESTSIPALISLQPPPGEPLSDNKQIVAKPESFSSESTILTTTTTTTKKPAIKSKKSNKHAQNHQRRGSTGSRRRTNKKGQHLLPEGAKEMTPDYQNSLAPENTCLMADACLRGGKLGPCFKPHKPTWYDRDDRQTEDFYEMLLESCPHFFDKEDNLRHSLCCSPEQEETISRLNANVDLIRRSCPSCLVNVKKLFCNLFCSPNQRDFIRVDRVKGEAVVDITYAISAQFVDNFFHSCQDVRVFGAYLLDYEYGCGKLKRANCTPAEFMRVLGSLSEMPFGISSLIVESPIAASDANDSKPRENPQWPRAVMNDTSYRCHEAPPNSSPCHCDHCPRTCASKFASPHQHTHNQHQSPNRLPKKPSGSGLGLVPIDQEETVSYPEKPNNQEFESNQIDLVEKVPSDKNTHAHRQHNTLHQHQQHHHFHRVNSAHASRAATNLIIETFCILALFWLLF